MGLGTNVRFSYLLLPVYLVWFVWKLGPGQIRHVEWASLDIGR
ncbi:MAG: hypothetical protein JWO38_4349 [Gemmataceae bacterium]|nr:hypothetical protein [Gemmataceae bacterium]